MGFFGIGEEELYRYTPQQYQRYGGAMPTYTPGAGYTPYGGELSDLYGGVTKEMLSGRLTPEEQAMLGKQLETGLATTREGAYGMPIGAQKGLESQAVQNVALQGLLMGQEKKRYGLQSALPYMQFQAGEGRYGYESGLGERRYGYESAMDRYKLGLGESRYGQEFAQTERGREAQYEADRKKTAAQSGIKFGDILSGAVSAGTKFGLSKIPFLN